MGPLILRTVLRGEDLPNRFAFVRSRKIEEERAQREPPPQFRRKGPNGIAGRQPQASTSGYRVDNAQSAPQAFTRAADDSVLHCTQVEGDRRDSCRISRRLRDQTL